MPVAIELAVDLVLVMAWIVAWGLLYAYRTSLKKLLLGIASVFRIRIGVPHIGGFTLNIVADAITSVADAIDHALATLVLATEKAVIVLIHGVAQQAKWLGNVLADLGETVEGKFKWWMALFPPAAAVWAAIKAYHGIVATIHALTAPVKHTIKVVQSRVQVLDKQAKGEIATLEGQVASLAERVESLAHSGTTAVTRGAGAAAGVIEQPIATTVPRIGNLVDDLGAIRSKVRALAKYLTPAGVVALIGATIFSQFRLNWLRCPSVGRIGRSLCGLGGVLETVFADAIVAFAISDLCRFANGIERVAEDIRPLMLEWVDVANEIYGCNDVTATPVLRLSGFTPTPLIDALTLA